MEQTQQPKPLTVRDRLFLLGEGLTFLAVLAGLFLLLYKDVRPYLSWELCGYGPEASEFLWQEGEAAFAGGTLGEDWTRPGLRLVLVEHEGSRRLSLLSVKDTTPPRAEGRTLTIGIDEELTADQCIEGLEDEQLVGVSFETAPVFHKEGTYEARIRLEDLSGNSAGVTACIHILAVQPQITVEAGAPLPGIEAFLPNDTAQGRFLTDMDTLSTAHAGVQPVELEVEGEKYTSYLYVQDTDAPRARGKLVYVRPGETAGAEAFIDTCTDETDVSFSFAAEPDWSKSGYQKVTVLARDEGQNETEVFAELFISPLAPVETEATGEPLEAGALGEGIELIDRLTLDRLGAYVLNVRYEGEPCPLLLSVVDTRPPEIAVPEQAEGYLNFPRPAESFIVSGRDATGYTCAFEREPDWSLAGPQQAAILCTDGAGNVTRSAFTLSLRTDDQPPRILYVRDLNGYVGEAVRYLAEVRAEDNCDGEIPVSVDVSAVDIYRAGTYPVVYTARDEAGNVTQARCRITLVEARVSEAEFEAALNACYDAIITPDMSLKEKGWTIFQYANQNIRYKASSDKKDWKYEAWRGITTGRGDCFTFCSVARALLEKAGAQVRVVTRFGGKKNTRHWWLLVDLGTGYYHFDAINVGPKGFECFMRTTNEVLKRSRDFWSFDQSLYPATPETPFSMEG